MAEAENPLIPIQQKVARIHTRLLDFFRNVLMKIRPIIQSLQGFLANIKKAAKDIAKVVGASAVQTVIKAGVRLIQLVTFVQKLAIEAIKMSIKTMAFIRKAAKDPQSAFKTVKAMVARLAKVYRTLVTNVFELLVSINPIEMVLTVINTMKMMLQMVFRWITQASPLVTSIKKVKNLIKKSAKLLKAEAKQVTELVKQANKLKPA